MFEDMETFVDSDHDIYMADSMFDKETEDLMNILDALEGEG